MKRKLSAILVALCLVVTLLPVSAAAAAYTDTEGHWAASSIDRWSDFGMIQGSNGQFNPNGTLTRAHMATMLCRLLNLPAAGNYGFLDVNADDWFADAVNRCAAAGIMLGNNGYANPNDPITREQALVMLCRALGLEEGDESVLEDFADADLVAPYARGYLAALVDAGILKGDNGRLNPKSNITRAQMVVIVDRIVDNYANKDGQTLNAKSGGTVLVVADDVTVKNAPAGTTIIVAEGVTGLTVNGKKVADGQTYTVPKTTTSSGSSSSGGGHSHSWTYTHNEDDTHTGSCVCGATKAAEDCSYGGESTTWSGAAPKTFKTCSVCGGEVVNNDVYYITSAADLNAFAAFVAGGNTFSGKTVKLTANIDFNGAAFSGIGASTVQGYPSNAFSGTFDGQGFEIKNMTIGSSTDTQMDGDDNRASYGFFNTLNGTVQNLKLTNVTVNSTHYAGTVTGYATAGSKIQSCTVANSAVTSTQWQKSESSYEDGDKAGGIIGYAAGVIVSNNTVKNSTITAFRDLGGIVGCADGAATTVTGNRVEDTTLTLTGATYTTIGEIIGRLNGDAAVGEGNTASNVTLNTLVTSAEGLAEALARGGNITIGADITIPDTWDAVSANYKDIAIDGGYHTISGLNNALFAYVGPGTVSVKNLTFADVNINNTAENSTASVLINEVNGEGGYEVTIENCHVNGGSIYGWKYAGGFIGFASNAKTPNTGSITVKNSTVKNVAISTTDSSVGGFIGHTYVNTSLENCTISDSSSVSCAEDRGGNDAKAGYFIGTINAGETEFKSCTVAENCTLRNTNAKPALFDGKVGRCVGSLDIADGVMVKNGVYEISTADGLMWFADQVNNKGNSFAGQTVKLTADIDLQGAAFTGIGASTVQGYPSNAFSGTFDGQGFEIKNMTIGSSTDTQMDGDDNRASYGFFNTLNGTVQNLKLTNVTVNSTHYAGTVTGYATAGSKIQSCTVANSAVTSTQWQKSESSYEDGDKAGGIIGYAAGVIVSNNTVKNSTITAFRDLGGIVGCADGSSTNVSGNTVDTVTLVKGSSSHGTVGVIVGRQEGSPTIGTNTILPTT